MVRVSRREFSRSAALSAISSWVSQAAPVHKYRIGHTSLTWGNDVDRAIHDIAALGYYGIEIFGATIESRRQSGGLAGVLRANNLPLISGFCTTDLTDPTRSREELAQSLRWARAIKSLEGTKFVIGPNSVPRQGFDFKSSRALIVGRLNETARAVTNFGLIPILQQRSGSCIETRDELYAVLEAADTRVLKFGPDTGQLARAGVDPVKVLTDFLPLVRHMHLKDYNGGEHYYGYCTLGQGKVNIPAILNLMDKANRDVTLMVELDPSPKMPIKPQVAAFLSKWYVQSLGYKFRFRS